MVKLWLSECCHLRFRPVCLDGGSGAQAVTSNSQELAGSFDAKPQSLLENAMASLTLESPIRAAVAVRRVREPLPGRIPQLDGLRGVAIAMVVLYHYFSLHFSVSPGIATAYLVYPTRFGWSGVDLFFVLSGFLIGGILLDAKGANNYFQVFYIRRFLRIVPVYYLLLIGFFSLIAWFGAHPNELWPWTLQENLPRYTYFLFLQNIFASISNSLGSAPLAVYWSLSIEEQFYFALPFLIRFFSRERIQFLAVEIILTAPVLRIALFSFYPTHPHAWYLLMPCRADSLFFGVLGAILLRDPKWRKRIARNRPMLGGMILFLAAGVPFIAQTHWALRGLIMVSLMFSWFAALYFLVLIYALTFTSSHSSRCLSWSWLRRLGVIAYGVYLLHEGVLDFALRVVSRTSGPVHDLPYGFVALLSVAITISLAQISWTYCEKRFVNFSHRYKYEKARNTETSPYWPSALPR
jgi:peptidoglycan/LPS O-acetylase OafA/YrhL